MLAASYTIAMPLDSLRFMTFNVFPGSPLPYVGGGIRGLAHSLRLKKQLAGIRELQPDVIFLQELYCVHALKSYTSAFPDYLFFRLPCCNIRGRVMYASLVGLLGAVAVIIVWAACWSIPWVNAHLVTHRLHYVFPLLFLLTCPAVHSCIRTSGIAQWLSGSAAELVTMVRNHDAFVSCQIVRCASRFFHHQAGDPLNYFAPRGVLSVQVEMSNGCNLALFNTHLNQSQEDCTGYRLAQAREVLDIIRDALSACRPGMARTPTVILGGDMNNGPESPEVIFIQREGALVDAFSAALETSGELTWAEANPFTHPVYVRGLPDARIDFVLVDQQMRVDSCSTAFGGPHFVSDHLAVVADATLDD